METRQLGNSDLRVPPIIYGAWAIGGWYWGGTDDEASVRGIHEAIDLGITAIDTAPMYGFGHSEEVVGRAIRGRRAAVQVLTKCGMRWDRDEGQFFFNTTDDNGKEYAVYRNLKRDSIVEECERSLKRLGVETIDLYQCHWPDNTTPLSETMETLLRLQEQGKIRHIGVSNFTPEMIETCRKHGSVVSNQPHYSLLKRDAEADILPYCREHNIGLIVYRPLEQGLLTGKYGPDASFGEGDNRANDRLFSKESRRRIQSALAKIQPIADAYNATLAQVTIAWTIGEPGITAAIVGARNPEQVRDNVGAVGILLSDGERKAIRDIFEGLDVPA